MCIDWPWAENILTALTFVTWRRGGRGGEAAVTKRRELLLQLANGAPLQALGGLTLFCCVEGRGWGVRVRVRVRVSCVSCVSVCRLDAVDASLAV